MLDFIGLVGLALSLTLFVLLTEADSVAFKASSTAFSAPRLISTKAASFALTDSFKSAIFYVGSGVCEVNVSD